MVDNKYIDKNLNEVISVLNFKTKRGTWEAFKQIVPRNKSLNEAVEDLIHKKLLEESEPLNEE